MCSSFLYWNDNIVFCFLQGQIVDGDGKPAVYNPVTAVTESTVDVQLAET